MDKFINHTEAMAFLDTVADPIVRALILRAYGTLIFEVAPVKVDGQFDLLFFFKVLERFMRDRENLAEMLREQPARTDGEPHPSTASMQCGPAAKAPIAKSA